MSIALTVKLILNAEYFAGFVLCLLRVAVTFAFGIVSLFANEFYPTPIRATGSGMLFSVGIFGSFLAPYMNQLSKNLRLNPYALLSLISLLGLSGTSMTEETLGVALKNQLEKSAEEKDQLNVLDSEI